MDSLDPAITSPATTTTTTATAPADDAAAADDNDWAFSLSAYGLLRPWR
jgi:hypothetical protein